MKPSTSRTKRSTSASDSFSGSFIRYPQRPYLPQYPNRELTRPGSAPERLSRTNQISTAYDESLVIQNESKQSGFYSKLNFLFEEILFLTQFRPQVQKDFTFSLSSKFRLVPSGTGKRKLSVRWRKRELTDSASLSRVALHIYKWFAQFTFILAFYSTPRCDFCYPHCTLVINTNAFVQLNFNIWFGQSSCNGFGIIGEFFWVWSVCFPIRNGPFQNTFWT